ncbi:MAG TPA: hypothetical protein VGK56_17415, partial [Anaerolineales bacterium]
FLQQCWSVHPLCVSVRRMTAGNQLILACTSCRFAHHLRLGDVAVRPSASEQTEPSTGESDAQFTSQVRFAACLQAHPAALTLREMDVFQDLAVIRCAECRRLYVLRVTAFETHQK